MIRLIDFFFALVGIIICLPLFILIGIVIAAGSRGGIFYLQSRVGLDNKDFRLIKFRTMRLNAEQQGGLTIGSRDRRITREGYLLRKYKLDELPQLLNVLKGDMSLVGPRPEIRKYVELYSMDQRIVLNVKPGITDYASIEYMDENELLGKSPDPEKTYIEVIMPAKIRLNLRYIENPTLYEYFRILSKTFIKLFR